MGVGFYWFPNLNCLTSLLNQLNVAAAELIVCQFMPWVDDEDCAAVYGVTVDQLHMAYEFCLKSLMS
jgi:hypothetical protein